MGISLPGRLGSGDTRVMKHTAWLAWGAVWALALAGCDQLKERAGLHDPAKIEAEGKAIGSACRQAGWGIEDCFRLNPGASKPAMFAGWKDMNEYMMKNNMEAMEPTVSVEGHPPSPRKSKKKLIDLEPIDKSQVEEPSKGEAKPAGKGGDKAGVGEDKAGAHQKEAPAH